MQWKDLEAGIRGHKLMTVGVAETIPPIYTYAESSPEEAVVHAKLFSPYSNWTWFIMELDPDTGLCFGLVEGFETELGYFDLTELAEVKVFGGVPAVERDLYWRTASLSDVKAKLVA